MLGSVQFFKEILIFKEKSIFLAAISSSGFTNFLMGVPRRLQSLVNFVYNLHI